MLHVQTWRESVQSLVSRNSPPTVDHSTYKEETNIHHSMIETQPTNAECATWKNSMNAHVRLKTPTNECGIVKTDVLSDLFQFWPVSQTRRRSCFSWTLGRFSIAICCQWRRIYLGLSVDEFHTYSKIVENCGNGTTCWCLRARRLDAEEPALLVGAWRPSIVMLSVRSDSLELVSSRAPDLQQNCRKHGNGKALGCLAGGVRKTTEVANQRC